MQPPDNIQIMRYKGVDWYHRIDKPDHLVIRETDYKFIQYEPTDVWIDAGANVGGFAFKASPKVSAVYSYEPEPGNVEVFLWNLSLHASRLPPERQPINVVLNPRALGAAAGEISFYVSEKHPYANSVLPIRGRKETRVECLAIDDEIRRHGANKLKLDVEGAERDIILGSEFPGITEIVMEWHTMYLDKTPHTQSELFARCMGRLGDLGFGYEVRKAMKKYGNESTVILRLKRGTAAT